MEYTQRIGSPVGVHSEGSMLNNRFYPSGTRRNRLDATYAVVVLFNQHSRVIQLPRYNLGGIKRRDWIGLVALINAYINSHCQ
jgi:hypothetical protein